MKILILAFHEKKFASDGILLGLRLCYETCMISPLTILITSRAYEDSIKKNKTYRGTFRVLHAYFTPHIFSNEIWSYIKVSKRKV